MNLQDIFSTEAGSSSEITVQINKLRLRPTDLPDTVRHLRQFDPCMHEVMDTAVRLDKRVSYEYEEEGKKQTGTKLEKVNRIPLSLQKRIVNSAVSFLFGNEVKVTASENGTDAQVKAFDVIQDVLNDVKIDSFNRKVARNVFTVTEAAEYWYVVDNGENNNYNIGSKFKLRCMLFSPMLGDILYPLFDEYGDLIAFSREFTRVELNKATTYFETYTKDKQYRWQTRPGATEWMVSEGYPKTNLVGKIPIVYARQELPEWSDVQGLIDRLEKIISNLGDTNDYHASPTIVAKGTVMGFASKGEQGKIIEIEDNGSVEYLSYDKAPETQKLEIDNLLRFIYTLTQTPDVSFESVKQLGVSTSGVALRLMFMDAHLKVKNKMEIFGEYLQRRMNLLKAFCSTLNLSMKNDFIGMNISIKVTPFMIDDEKTMVELLATANNGKPIISQKTSVRLSGLVDDYEEEYAMILEEAKQEATLSLSSPTIA